MPGRRRSAVTAAVLTGAFFLAATPALAGGPPGGAGGRGVAPYGSRGWPNGGVAGGGTYSFYGGVAGGETYGGYGGRYYGGYGGGYPGGYGGLGGYGGYPNPGYRQGYNQQGYNQQGNNQQGYNPYIIVPYQVGPGYNGYPNYPPSVQQGPPGPGGPPQKRFGPDANTFLYGQEGSVSFYATPPGNSAGAPADPPPPADYPRSYPTDRDVPPVPLPSAVPLPAATVASVRVHLPPDARLWFEGAETRQTGGHRAFKSPPLEPDRDYLYDLKARWTEGGKPVEKNRTVTVRAGYVTDVDLTGDN